MTAPAHTSTNTAGNSTNAQIKNDLRHCHPDYWCVLIRTPGAGWEISGPYALERTADNVQRDLQRAGLKTHGPATVAWIVDNIDHMT